MLLLPQVHALDYPEKVSGPLMSSMGRADSPDPTVSIWCGAPQCFLDLILLEDKEDTVLLGSVKMAGRKKDLVCLPTALLMALAFFPVGEAAGGDSQQRGLGHLCWGSWVKQVPQTYCAWPCTVPIANTLASSQSSGSGESTTDPGSQSSVCAVGMRQGELPTHSGQLRAGVLANLRFCRHLTGQHTRGQGSEPAVIGRPCPASLSS